MPDRSDEFRKRAAQCVAVARVMDDPCRRAILLTMAQRWYDMANGATTDFDAIQRVFNESQLSDPPRQGSQQQQQIQPKPAPEK